MLLIFDDQKEPADIFSDIPSEKPTDRPLAPRAPGVPAPGQIQPATTPFAVGESGVVIEHAPFGKKLFIIMGVVLLLALGAGAYFMFFRAAPVVPPVEEPQPEPEPEPEPAPEPLPEPEPEPTTDTTTTIDILPPPPPPSDRDGDGLTDDEEASLGTNPDLVDTDNDGLNDREEVRTYRTDPRNPDTDGDTYPDGQEVSGGYDPNGPGRLIQIP